MPDESKSLGRPALLEALGRKGVSDDSFAEIISQCFKSDKMALRLEGAKIYARIRLGLMAASPQDDPEFKKAMDRFEKLKTEREREMLGGRPS